MCVHARLASSRGGASAPSRIYAYIRVWGHALNPSVCKTFLVHLMLISNFDRHEMLSNVSQIRPTRNVAQREQRHLDQHEMLSRVSQIRPTRNVVQREPDSTDTKCCPT
ncbi:hypothetical protein DPMN_044858 [Dreissena polymorpha]|uniref:Uncharacterized protein n=1 Tax=Dreissena polymorpha TaxID=45954 RepID=A0A9D4D6L5_DREPO|nr:hypothetical protein DPMN_044858 [Dreissena polymorpha]